MNMEEKYREFLPEVRRVVIKVGTHAIALKSGRPDVKQIERIVAQLSALQHRGIDVVFVSSGAVGAGMEALGLTCRPTETSDIQMCAAVGQARLMACYEALFAKQGIVIGQVLLTHADFQSRIRCANAKRTMEHMIRKGIIPVVNENDVVADEEIKVLSLGDNDWLSSLVVKLVRADALVILSTVDGVLDHAGKRVSCVSKMADVMALVKPKDANSLSRGGMESKLKAVSNAVRSGCGVVIADGRGRDTLTRIFNGKDVGTFFLGAAL